MGQSANPKAGFASTHYSSFSCRVRSLNWEIGILALLHWIVDVWAFPFAAMGYIYTGSHGQRIDCMPVSLSNISPSTDSSRHTRLLTSGAQICAISRD